MANIFRKISYGFVRAAGNSYLSCLCSYRTVGLFAVVTLSHATAPPGKRATCDHTALEPDFSHRVLAASQAVIASHWVSLWTAAASQIGPECSGVFTGKFCFHFHLMGILRPSD